MVRIFPARYSTGHKTLCYAYMFIISSPISPIISPQPFFTVIFSLNKTEESFLLDYTPDRFSNGEGKVKIHENINNVANGLHERKN